MASYVIDGVKCARRSLIKLSPAERASVTAGRAELRRPVEWPLPAKLPDFGRAYRDAGGSLWGTGPYLKVPNRLSGGAWEAVNRLFCPWGYPPGRLRISRSARYLRLVSVEVARVDVATWEWLLTVESMTVANTIPPPELAP